MGLTYIVVASDPVAAVLVFLASSLFHMVLPFHQTRTIAVAAEDAVMDAVRPFNLAPGDYLVLAAQQAIARPSSSRR